MTSSALPHPSISLTSSFVQVAAYFRPLSHQEELEFDEWDRRRIAKL